MNFSEIKTTCLIINCNQVKKNIKQIKEKAQRHNLVFRPHFKTHQSNKIANIFKNEGISKITVSSFEMALQFIQCGYNDICIAIPFNIREISTLNSISSEISIHICIESIFVLNYLKRNLNRNVGVYIKTDCGYNRTGIESSEINQIHQCIETIHTSPNMSFSGLLTHSGNTYHCKSISEIKSINTESILKLQTIKKSINQDINISIGDTPSISICDNFDDVTEIRPGNFVFFDLTQYYLGVCSIDQISATIVAPVIAKNKTRNEIIIHAGAVHLSSEFLPSKLTEKNFGEIKSLIKKDAVIEFGNRPIIKNLSQEHGIIQVSHNQFEKISHGDLLQILPIHSCLTNNLLKNKALIYYQ